MTAQAKTIPEEVDIIIVGGGAAGSVIAGRLAKADPTLQILIIESGLNNSTNPDIFIPAHYLRHFHPDDKSVELYVSKRTSGIPDRDIVVPVGNVLGGGTSVNVLAYTRGSASDYDDWDTEGWAFKDLKPLFKKTETYHMDAKNDTHGHDGPMQVSAGWSRSTLAEEYISVAKSRGIEVTDDIQDFSSESINKVSKWPKWINPIDGKRSDAATAFVHPILQTQSNLHLLLISKVVRVLFEGTRAVGVEFIPKYRPPKLSNQSKTFTTSSDETPRIARARKLVVLSSGSLATPQILQRSGVGDSSKLHSLGISNISDIPAVGMNYQDHPFIAGVASFTDAQSSDTGDDIIRATPETITSLEEQFIREKGGILSRNFIDAGIKLRPTDQEVSSLGIEFEKHWKQRFAGKPDKPLLTFLLINPFPGEVPEGRYMSMVFCLKYPLSRGSIHITSANDIYSTPDFDGGMFSNTLDALPYRWAYKKGREIIRRMESFRGEWAPSHPEFPAGSNAAVKPFVRGEQVEDIVYTAEDDVAIDIWVRKMVQSMCHPLGTCAMKKRENGGVVDRDLNVYGTTGLKVAGLFFAGETDLDLSIAPSNVGANTASTALVIGEKAAMIIAKELGISGV